MSQAVAIPGSRIIRRPHRFAMPPGFSACTKVRNIKYISNML